ncbi:MAG: hypothetical protein ACTHLZ_19675 [Tepidisphaeraceae bacterium]
MNRRAFTLVELCLGMLVTAVLAFAAATFTTAVVSQWSDGNRSQMLDVSLFQARAVVGPIVESARQVAAVYNTPTPAVFLWQNDTLNGPDQKRQFAELALLEYDATTQTIYYYQADASNDLVNNATAMQTVSDADLADPNLMAVFKSQTWLKPKRALLGPGRVIGSSTEVARVTQAVFQPVTSNTLPQLEWSATVARGDATVSFDDTLTLRAPTTVVAGVTP